MHITKRVKQIQPSATMAITAKAKAMKKEGKAVISLGAGEPDFDTPKNIKEAAKTSIDEGHTKYTPAAGMPQLREAIAKKFERENSISYQASQIIVSNGAKHSLMNICLALLEEGDEAILIKPYWLSYEEQIRVCGARPIFAETNKGEVQAELIKETITDKTKILVINSPCNPSGKIIAEKELKKIAELCVQHKIICVSDEVYEHIIFDDKEHISIASLGKDIYEQTITVNAVSKTYSMTGWRIGYCGGPQEIITAMTSLQSHSSSGPSTTSQHAALEAITGEQKEIEDMRTAYEKRRNFVIAELSKTKGITCPKPEGTFYAFPNIQKTGLSSMEFCEQILEQEQVAIIPGKAFGDDQSVRISFATSMEELKEGMKRIQQFCTHIGERQ